MSADDGMEWLSLDDGEEVVWTGQPAFETLYGTIATGLILCVVLIGFLILLGVPFSYLGLRNTDYVVTNQSLYVKQGVFSTNIETVDLDRIQNTEYSQSFWGKQFGYGTIAISTAGSSGTEISFSGIPDAKDVRDRITEVRNEYTGRGSDGTGGGATDEGTAGAVTPASADQIEELVAEVRATREAFERIEERIVAEATAENAAAESVASEEGSADVDAGRDGEAN